MIQFICRVALIVLYAMSLGIYLVKDGEPRNENYSFCKAAVATALMFALMAGAGTFS